MKITIPEITNIADKVGENTKGFFSYIMEPRKNAEIYLMERITKNGELQLSDVDSAALLMLVRKNVKKLKNNRAIIDRANRQFEELFDEAAREKVNHKHLNEDWLDYFLDMSQYSSEEAVQEIWARLLVKEQNENNSIPKSMLNVLAMMDSNLARAFTNLVKISFLYDTGDEAEVLPLVIGSYYLQDMREKYSDYKKIFDSYEELIPSLFELEKLVDLGLIRMNNFQRENFIYFSENRKLTLMYGLFSMITDGMRDEEDFKCFLTGQTLFTFTGATLYDTLIVQPFEGMPDLIQLFADYQEKHKNTILKSLL